MYLIIVQLDFSISCIYRIYVNFKYVYVGSLNIKYQSVWVSSESVQAEDKPSRAKKA